MKKALEQQPTSEDCVSRQAVNKYFETLLDGRFADFMNAAIMGIKDHINVMPTVKPTHGTCKDCKHYYMDEDGHGYHCEKFDYTRFPVYADFYCADYEKRGNEE